MIVYILIKVLLTVLSIGASALFTALVIRRIKGMFGD